MAAEAVWEVILIIEDRLKNKYDDPTFQRDKLFRHRGWSWKITQENARRLREAGL